MPPNRIGASTPTTRTEDHTLDYADFEGRIPAGEYGAGTVVVWDHGALQNRTERDGQEIPLQDALTRTKMRGDDRNWLLVKVDDDDADRRRKPERAQPESVISGRTNKDLED